MPIIASVGLLQMMAFTGLGMVAMVHVDTSRAVLLARVGGSSAWATPIKPAIRAVSTNRLGKVIASSCLKGWAMIIFPITLKNLAIT